MYDEGIYPEESAVITTTEEIVASREENRLHLGELSKMAQKLSKDEQIAMCEMFDTDVMFDVLKARFGELERVIGQVRHLFVERGKDDDIGR